MINCAFIFLTINLFWLLPRRYGPTWTYNTCFYFRLRCTLDCAAFKSHTDWSHVQHAMCTPSIAMLPNIVNKWHGLNRFGHVICTLQTCRCENIAELLTHPSKALVFINNDTSQQIFLFPWWLELQFLIFRCS